MKKKIEKEKKSILKRGPAYEYSSKAFRKSEDHKTKKLKRRENKSSDFFKN